MTHGEAFFSDPRIKQALDLILQALQEHQKPLQNIQEAPESAKKSYFEQLHLLESMRGGKLFHPYLGSGLGFGPFVELADGSVKFDAITGIGPHLFGHSHPEIIRAGVMAGLEDTLMQGNLQQNTRTVEVLKKLLDLSQMDHGFLTTSGAMACENALKLAFHHHPGKTRIMAFEHCFMGRSLALANITDKASYRVGLPECLPVDYIPFYDEKLSDGGLEACKSAMDVFVKRYPGAHSAFVAELIQGEGGFRVASASFLCGILEHAKRLNLVVIIDEVQTFLRTSEPFAFQHFGLQSLVDIVTLGKASQVCATLFTDDMTPKPGLLSQTFTASTSSLHGFLAILHLLQEREHFGKSGRNMQLQENFTKRLEKLRSQHPSWLSGPYGLGIMVAFTPWDGSEKSAHLLCHTLFEEGIICFIAGENPTRIRFLLPALVMEESHLDLLMQILEKAFFKTEKKLRNP